MCGLRTHLYFFLIKNPFSDIFVLLCHIKHYHTMDQILVLKKVRVRLTCILFKILIASCTNLQFFANIFVHLLTLFCWKLICMYVLRWCMSEKVVLKKLLLVVAHSCKLRFFLRMCVCARLWLIFYSDFAEN